MGRQPRQRSLSFHRHRTALGNHYSTGCLVLAKGTVDKTELPGNAGRCLPVHCIHRLYGRFGCIYGVFLCHDDRHGRFCSNRIVHLPNWGSSTGGQHHLPDFLWHFHDLLAIDRTCHSLVFYYGGCCKHPNHSRKEFPLPDPGQDNLSQNDFQTHGRKCPAVNTSETQFQFLINQLH